MFKLKGTYTWELRDAKTGTVKEKGSQENIITDAGYQGIVGIKKNNSGTSFGDPFADTGPSPDRLYIFNSETTPTPSTDFLRLSDEEGLGGIVVNDQGQPLAVDTSNDGTFWEGSFLFSPPGSTKTHTILGILHSSTNDVLSFITLSSPITQTTSDQFFVTYRVEIAFVGTGLNGISSPYTLDKFSGRILTTEPNSSESGFIQFMTAQLTQFLPPIVADNVGRDFGSPLSNDLISRTLPPYNALRADLFRTIYSFEFQEVDTPAPHGVMAHVYIRDDSRRAVVGINPITPLSNITDLFKKASGDLTPYNNPTPPFPISKGTASLGGTPTQLIHSKEIRAFISKSGDASDIVDEAFDPSDVNTGSDEITVGQDYDNTALGSQVTCEFTTTGTLPTGLTTSTTFYIIFVNSTTLQISASEGGGAIDFTNQGTGTHTLVRTSTAKFKLRESAINNLDLFHTMPIEIDGTPQSSDNLWGNSLISTGWSVYVSDTNGKWLYKPIFINSVWRLTKWRYGTIESAIKTIDVGAPFGAINIGDKIYFIDAAGLNIYDTVTDTITDTFTSVTAQALLETACTDITYDRINNIIWIGHALGLTEFDPVGKTVNSTHDISGTFSGLTAARIEIFPGQLTASHGFISRGGEPGQRDDNWNPVEVDEGWVWVYDSLGTGKVAQIDPTGNDSLSNPSFPFGRVHFIGLKGNGNGDLIAECGDTYKASAGNDAVIFEEITLNFVPATPEHTVVQTVGQSTVNNDSESSTSRLFRISADMFVSIQFLFGEEVGILIFNPSLGTVFETNVDTSSATNPSGSNNDKMAASIIFIEGSVVLSFGRELIKSLVFSDYGWNGSDWDLDTIEGQDVPKSPVLLTDGVTIDFANAGGQPSLEQFIIGEAFTFGISPMLIKTNLQKLQYTGAFYGCDVTQVTSFAMVIPATPFEFYVPEAPLGSGPLADFRFIDDDPTLITVNHISEGDYTQVVGTPITGEYAIDAREGKLTFAAADEGKTLSLTYLFGERH